MPLQAKDCGGNPKEDGAEDRDTLILYMNPHKTQAQSELLMCGTDQKAAYHRLWEVN